MVQNWGQTGVTAAHDKTTGRLEEEWDEWAKYPGFISGAKTHDMAIPWAT